MDEMERSIEQQRLMRIRRMARKLAKNQSQKRVVRKLPQTMVIVPKAKPRRALQLHGTVSRSRRLAYIMILGAALCAYVADLDQNTLEHMLRSVGQATHSHLGGLLGNT